MILRSEDNKVFKTASAALFDKRSDTEVATINDIDGVDDFMAEIGESDINPSLALTANGSFKEDKLLSVLPPSGGGDFTVTGGGNTVSQRSDGTWQINWPANTPRFSWMDGVPSILVESQRQNLITYPRSFGNAYWTKIGATVTGGFSCPFVNSSGVNTLEGFKLVEDTSTGVHQLQTNISLSGTNTYTLSIRAKSAGNNRGLVLSFAGVKCAVFNIDAKTLIETNNSAGLVTVLSTSIKDDGDGYTLYTMTCSVTFTGNSTFRYILTQSTTSNNDSYTGDGTSGIYICHAQLEQAATASSPIYGGEGSALTRLADNISKTDASALIGQTEGTVFVDFNLLSGIFQLQKAIIVLRNATGYFIFISIDSDGDIRYVITPEIEGGSIGGNVIVDAPAGRYKIGLAYKSGDIAIYVNGVQRIVDASAFTFSTTLSAVDVGNYLGTQVVNDSFNEWRLFKTRLSNDQLQALTTL